MLSCLGKKVLGNKNGDNMKSMEKPTRDLGLHRAVGA